MKQKLPNGRARRKRFPWWTLPVITLMACALFFAYVTASEQLSAYEEFERMRAEVSRDTFYDGISIDGVALGGMTMDEARAALADRQTVQADSFDLFLDAGEMTWRISSQEVPMSWNTEELLQRAWAIGRAGTLEERYAAIRKLKEPGLSVAYFSEFTYDRQAVRALTDEVAARLTVEPKNASVVAFNVTDRTFAFSDEQMGQRVDAEALYQTVVAMLDQGSYGATVPVSVQTVSPSVTRAQLEANYGLISTYTTKTTSNENRNTNIRLAAEAFNGLMIAPGEEISFNETTGERTREKGYLEAGAIENGRTVQEVGGGVCQVSSTLFNTLLRANFDIVTRRPHAWPSDYVPRGEDATVDWPRLDLVMRNTSEAPVFLAAWYEDRTVTVEAYGLSLGEGLSIDLWSETSYTKTPTEIVETYNPDLPVGTREKVKDARTGYRVETYKLWLQNGVEISREYLYTSEYATIYEEYEYNYGYEPEEP